MIMTVIIGSDQGHDDHDAVRLIAYSIELSDPMARAPRMQSTCTQLGAGTPFAIVGPGSSNCTERMQSGGAREHAPDWRYEDREESTGAARSGAAHNDDDSLHRLVS
jgi:hypothetical protein